MNQQLRTWLSLREYNRRLRSAEQQAASQAHTLLSQHNAIARQLPLQPDATASVGRLRQLSGQRKTLIGLDQRVDDTKQLVNVYRRWSGLVENRRRAVLRLILRSLAAILGILLAAVLLNGAIRRAFPRTDRRRLHQIRVIGRITLQVAAVLAILLILFGPPTQLSTMIGLITAGLTVVMKDFIVAFFGWFTLLGKDGISVGDWVEIEGVSGEVVEIGLLKTVLLELGNWTGTGQPTGRLVSFSNSFAMERHYFNFSTSGQWLWDELQVTLPPESDPYRTAEQIREHRRARDAGGCRRSGQGLAARRPSIRSPRVLRHARRQSSPGRQRGGSSGPLHHPRAAAQRRKIEALPGHRRPASPACIAAGRSRSSSHVWLAVANEMLNARVSDFLMAATRPIGRMGKNQRCASARPAPACRLR